MNANQLREQFAALPPIEPITTWDKHRLALRDHVANHSIERFLRWSTIQATMFVGEAPYIRLEYDELIKDHYAWEEAIKEPGFGSPQRLSYAPHTSGNLVHQAYHYKQWFDKSNLKGGDTVFEIGGGYGAMALLFRKLGYKNTYVIYDVPEFALLQEFYLSNTVGFGYDAKIHSAPQNYEFAPRNLESVDLLIALYSLSEIPLDERNALMDNLNVNREKFIKSTPIRSYLFAYQQSWDGVDNHEWFNDFVATRPDLEWHNWRVPHMPANWYMVGV